MKIILRTLNFYKQNWKEITGGIVSISAIIVTVIQFLDYRENEFRKSLFTEQVQIYAQLLDRSSELSHYNKDNTDKPHFQNALREYEKFQRGKLMLVNDNQVRNKVRTFFNHASMYFRSNMEKSALQNSLDSLSNCCRKSLQETFEVSLPELTLTYTEEDLNEFDSTFDKSE